MSRLRLHDGMFCASIHMFLQPVSIDAQLNKGCLHRNLPFRPCHSFDRRDHLDHHSRKSNPTAHGIRDAHTPDSRIGYRACMERDGTRWWMEQRGSGGDFHQLDGPGQTLKLSENRSISGSMAATEYGTSGTTVIGC